MALFSRLIRMMIGNRPKIAIAKPRIDLNQLDRLVTKNEVAYLDLKREVIALRRKEDECIRSAHSMEKESKVHSEVILEWKRLVRRRKHAESRLHIHDRNMRIEENLAQKMNHACALDMVGVSPEDIQDASESYERALEDHELLGRLEGEIIGSREVRYRSRDLNSARNSSEIRVLGEQFPSANERKREGIG
ncbi:MAG: hypothetical protein QF752_12870 [Planctomycetota bacterium]|jgi:hypothetical protein|nr:hypothetical protein [Planctomycetota bacterium]